VAGAEVAKLRLINLATSRMSTRKDHRGRKHPPRHSSEQQSTRQRATDQEIQKWIARQHGFVPESAWILYCKEQFGLVAPGTAPEENPCPPEKVAAIKQRLAIFVQEFPNAVIRGFIRGLKAGDDHVCENLAATLGLLHSKEGPRNALQVLARDIVSPINPRMCRRYGTWKSKASVAVPFS
jgi:hypothetical protein